MGRPANWPGLVAGECRRPPGMVAPGPRPTGSVMPSRPQFTERNLTAPYQLHAMIRWQIMKVGIGSLLGEGDDVGLPGGPSSSRPRLELRGCGPFIMSVFIVAHSSPTALIAR